MRAALIVGIVLLSVAVQAQSGTNVQPGFYSHEPENVSLRISNGKSGPLCKDVAGQSAVCEIARKIQATGQETCLGDNGQQYRCTRYGYQYDYSGAEPGSSIVCKSTRRSAFRSGSMDYTVPLDAASGRVFVPSSMPYQDVDSVTLITEVHDCTYQGEALTTIEYIVSFEPALTPTVVPSDDGLAPGYDEPYFDEIPNACERPYLTEATAGRLMDAQNIQEGGATNEHIPNLWSQCTFTSIGAPIKTVRFAFKFMLYDLFDVDRLSTPQLRLNATVAASGNPPSQQLDDLGKVSFVYEIGDSTLLMVVTGITGPPDGAGRRMEFVANYYLDDPERSHATRLKNLIDEAVEDLKLWHSGD